MLVMDGHLGGPGELQGVDHGTSSPVPGGEDLLVAEVGGDVCDTPAAGLRVIARLCQTQQLWLTPGTASFFSCINLIKEFLVNNYNSSISSQGWLQQAL